MTATINGEFEKTYVKWLTAEEIQKLEEKDVAYEALEQYKASREESDRKALVDEVISAFSYLKENDEFKEVYDKRYDFESIKALEDACYIIKGKYSISAPSRETKGKEPEIPVGIGTAQMTLREQFHEAYGKK